MLRATVSSQSHAECGNCGECNSIVLETLCYKPEGHGFDT
jgi:hypothetical protein